VNASGVVVGESSTAGYNDSHPFVWTPTGGIVDLGTPGGTYSSAYAVNDGGQIVGVNMVSANAWHAELWSIGNPVPPTVSITINGSHGSVTIPQGVPITISISFSAGTAGVIEPAEIYLGIASADGTVVWLDPITNTFVPTATPVYAGHLRSFGPTVATPIQAPFLIRPGRYWWLVVVDNDSNGVPNGPLYDFTRTILQ